VSPEDTIARLNGLGLGECSVSILASVGSRCGYATVEDSGLFVFREMPDGSLQMLGGDGNPRPVHPDLIRRAKAASPAAVTGHAACCSAFASACHG
jgi:hypothetical protein